MLQVILSMFKLFCNKFCVATLVRSIAPYIASAVQSDVLLYEREFMLVQLLVTLFNNIAIPCVVVALINPSCFYNVLVAAQKVNANYS